MAGKSPVTIKGVKEGLVFLLDDQCSFDELLQELDAKLAKHEQHLIGPIIHIFVKLGSRQLQEDELEQLRQTFRKQGNLVIQSIESDAHPPDLAGAALMTHTGIVRSGQTLEYRGHLLLLGDVNPGGIVRCTGDIYVLGSLRGIAHAGSEGDECAIIAASYMRPTQLRIADVISRPPDEWVSPEPWMEYAFLREGRMEIDKLSSLGRHRLAVKEFKGV
jgi:septum site-determining protein MinC